MTEMQAQIDKCNALLDTTHSSLDEKDKIIEEEIKELQSLKRCKKILKK
jgi:hypothetical protein